MKLAKIWMRILLLVLGLGAAGLSHAFEDDEACLMCHKYPKMGRIAEDGTRKVYYILPEVFSKTVHRNVPCRDCHSYIKELPHKPVTEGVNCSQECHSVKNPSTGKPFSHKTINDTFQQSVHGRAKIETGLNNDKPYCTTCHTNPLYNPAEKALPQKITDRCNVCHEDSRFVGKWYNHTSRRIREVKRSSKEIVAMCSACHSNKDMVERHQKAAGAEGRSLGRKFPIAIESYSESFHGKVTKYGNTEVANCLDCHASQANYYMSVHDIRPSRDPKSSLSKENRVETCKRCHQAADENYAVLDPHPSSKKDDNLFRYYAEIIYGLVGDAALFGLIGLTAFETVGRRRDGASWFYRNGTSWWRRSKRGRDRIEPSA
ncbi:multiheme c-type cytochrome [Noviherbaspirillum denitrificans]|uniref:Outer membrane cytochrome MtrC/MtrF-like domain-containing protein n=1 Tax=Noviherbaspirillum denitrificans TaxID=1968433 RepID=A0A254T6Y5_9BURK|nr:hypothetical protein [Noviherbaspirillum denitrificans]OWW18390.1 hypothetical protein AYR66_01980 [Noviherbaspirillum denitrificans]